jgi:hypothetical protein
MLIDDVTGEKRMRLKTLIECYADVCKKQKDN